MSIEKRDTGLIIVSVEDNGDDLSEEALDLLCQKLEMKWSESFERTGILNVQLRMRLKFGKDYGLKASRSALGGLKVEMHIPAAQFGEREE
ncbi:hypothetical protein N6H14_20350 [Paenibacillus sp. CC-CFT747]|nr:hypothetical protein N6H14_20350 [Paenibacillus sp. CC-CFT747]